MWRLSLCPFFKLCCWSPAPPAPLLTCRVACSHVSPRGSRTCHRWPCCSSQSSPHYRSVSTCLRLSPLKSRQWWESFSCESTWLLSSHPPPALSNPGKHNRENVLGFFSDNIQKDRPLKLQLHLTGIPSASTHYQYHLNGVFSEY